MNKKTILKAIFFMVLLFIFFIPRFYNLDKRIGFDWDQEKIAFEVKNIVVNHKLTLLGPHLVYLLIPFFILAQFSPYAVMYFVIAYCVLFFSSLYLS